MKLLRKATATVALLTLVSGYFSVGVNAYSTAQLEAANALAAEGIIVTQDDAAGYALDQQVLRQEIAAVARGVAGLEKTTVCNNVFADVSEMVPNNWACYSIEALYNEGLIASNDTFRPEANISKAEAVGMMVKAAYGSEYEYNDALSTTWQEQVVAFAVEKGIISSFSNYDTAATRGFVFEVGANAMADEEDEEDLLGDLLGELLGGDDEDMDDEDTTTEDDEDMDDEDTTVTISGDDVLEITLSPSTPEAATIPGNISGLPVAKYDFTAGNEDVTVTSITVKRKGLSDKDTLTALAVFTEEGRASKSKNDSQENDTQALLTLSNGGFVIQAGETETITIVADVNETSKANGDEFAIQLLDVDATSDVEMDTLIAETMSVGGVDAAAITISTDGGVSDPKVGDDEVEIFKFKVEGATDEDVILKSITFKGEGSVDEEDEIINYVLEMEGEVVAETAYANDKYVTFDLGDGVTIAEDKDVSFTVIADIVGGVTKTIAFKIDKTLDVSAEGTKYGFGASVDIDLVDAEGDLGSLTIDAGELTLSDIDASSDKIRADKKNVDLGSIKVTNISGADLELQKFTVTYDITSTSTGYDSAIEIFENFEAEINGTTYELDLDTTSATVSTGTYSDTDLDVIIPEGTTEILLRADTKKSVPANVTVDLSVENIKTNGNGFYVVETDEEEPVSDITPSSLSFKKLTFIDAGATLTAVPLADVKVVRGSTKIVANQFEITAEEASDIIIDEVQATLKVNSSSDFSTNAANLYVSEVALYKTSVSDSNLLDRVSGSKISSAGNIDFDGFEVTIPADDEETFLVTVSIVDGSDVEDKVIAIDVSGSKVSAEDDDNDDVTVSGSSTSNKDITVKASGTMTVAKDGNNDANEDPKTILAGSNEIIFSADVQATNEEVDVETVTFTVTYDGTGSLSRAVDTATLYLDGTAVKTNSNSDITFVSSTNSTGTIVFTDMNDFIVPEENVEFELKLNTANIGYEKVGEAISNIVVTNVVFSEAEGVDSGKTVANVTLGSGAAATASNTAAIVPAVITPSVYASLNSSTTPQIQITADAGNNTVSTSNTTPDVEIDTIKFSLLGTTILDGSVTFTLVNADDTSNTSVTGSVNSGSTDITFDLTNGSFDTAGLNKVSDGSSERFKIVITGTEVDEDTIELTLPENGITYKVDTTTGIKTNLTSELEFGSRTY